MGAHNEQQQIAMQYNNDCNVNDNDNDVDVDDDSNGNADDVDADAYINRDSGYDSIKYHTRHLKIVCLPCALCRVL